MRRSFYSEIFWPSNRGRNEALEPMELVLPLACQRWLQRDSLCHQHPACGGRSCIWAVELILPSAPPLFNYFKLIWPSPRRIQGQSLFSGGSTAVDTPSPATLFSVCLLTFTMLFYDIRNQCISYKKIFVYLHVCILITICFFN